MKNTINTIYRYILKNKILIIILILAATLRFWKLGSIPPGLTPDEASLGYNAYSILKTGRDEFGTTLPIIFKSFGDYKPGLYVYLTVPSVAVFGLSEFSTRLPSALFGVVSVLLIYFVCAKLFNKKLGLFAALVASINPWLIYFSHAAWEANVSLGLTLFGIYFFLKSFGKAKFLILSAIFFALTLLTYQGAKLSSAIVVLILIGVYWRDFWKIPKKFLLSSGACGIIISIPIILSLFTGQTERLTIFSIFSYHRPVGAVQSLLSEGGEKNGGASYYVFHSEALNYFLAVAGRWFNNFSGRFLFFSGDWANPVSTAPYQGVLLITDLLLIPLGLFATFKKNLGKGEAFVFLWLILAPFSAAISRDEVNAVRDLNLAVPLIIFSAFGLLTLSNWLSEKVGKVFCVILLFTFYFLPFTYFMDAYFIHVPAHNSNYWRYGYREAVQFVIPLEKNYKNIVFEQSFNQPYIYFLFYGPKDPAKYQRQEKLVNSQYIGDVGFEEKIDNVEFKNIDWEVLKKARGTLVVASPESLPPNFLADAKFLKEIKYLNGRDVAFDILEIK